MTKAIDELIHPKRFRRGLDLGTFHPVIVAPVEEMPAPDRVYIPLKQHVGSTCEPKVAVGDKVKIGQILGESADMLAAPVHAPVSGKVVKIGDHPDSFGNVTPTIVIANDGMDKWVDDLPSEPDFAKAKVSALIRAVRRSGIVQPETGIPAHALMAPPERPKAYIFLVGIPLFKPVELIIVNGLDLEPSMAVNRRMLQEYPEDVLQAIKLVKKISGAPNALLAVSPEMGASAPAVRTATGDEAKTLVVENRYPVAKPELLTTAITGREVPWPGGDTRDVGTLVFSVETLLAILNAVKTGRPQIDRVVSVSGSDFTPRNLRVRLGTPIEKVIAFAGGDMDSALKVVAGGLMDGQAQYSGLAPVSKRIPALHLVSSLEQVEISEHLCIKCGRCIRVCPMRLTPNEITNFCEFGFFEEAEAAELFNCIECGCCAFVCPAKRPLVQYVKHGKAEVTAKRAAI